MRFSPVSRCRHIVLTAVLQFTSLAILAAEPDYLSSEVSVGYSVLVEEWIFGDLAADEEVDTELLRPVMLLR